MRLKILTLPCLYIYETVIFVNTNRHLFNKFKSVRLHNKIKSQPSNTALLQKSILGMSRKMYNNLPQNIVAKNGNEVDFKKSLKAFLIEKAYYSLAEFFG